ncbi:hypothetical protein Rgna01_24060 [Mediterraneibacter gnavus]|uniref:Uncharacterized protein n=2 Tax=Mediterraneibacter gnavus TaxID=33038 RepID=A0A2N5NXX3_MEDGN|nr:hypothetical protein CDL18_15055 [Mediterraneibacter gnavus]PQL32929.1 hypothetical protein C5Y99_14475 [Mediterraneibacter gnavus ATCC 29149]RJW17402.1 hypothetical protein DXD70_15430 [Lachnospiraceae bacterium TM07-2AC]HBJ44084.1 hypothetical protein [Ruminococcus sp.]PLT52322.1 hypothetical protein CDL22_15180 [Mediterraneibacter gnavus]
MTIPAISPLFFFMFLSFLHSYFSFEIIKVHPDFVKEYTSYRNKPVLIHREKYENFTGKISG